MQEQIRHFDYNLCGLDFDYIYIAAKMTRCNIFYLDKVTNKLYGVPSEPYKVHVVDIPFPITNNLLFELSNRSMPMEELKACGFNVFQSDNRLRYTLIPIEYYDDYLKGYLRMTTAVNNTLQLLYDINGEKRITGYKAIDDGDFIYNTAPLEQIEKVRNFILRNLDCYNESYPNIESDPQIIRILNSKVADGVFSTVFGNGEYKRIFLLFKGFFNTNKGDNITLSIYYDDPVSTMTQFSIKHKKNVFRSFQYGSTAREAIYCRFLNL